MSDSDNNNILELYQCDYNRRIEESFAQVLTEKELIRFFFINEDRAFTDGRSIVVDPAVGNLYEDVDALLSAEEFLRIPPHFSNDPWNALRIITRGLNIHECLHILYTDFPLPFLKDKRSTTEARIKALSLINNIIEDAFIECAGCSVFDNIEIFLKFHKVAHLFAKTPSRGTTSQVFEEEIDSRQMQYTLPLLLEYINYMGVFLLYPMIEQAEPITQIADYVSKTKQLFLEGSICGEPTERYGFTQKIFDIIEPLIPLNSKEIDEQKLSFTLVDRSFHTGDNLSINTINNKGKSVVITRRLFSDLEGNPQPIVDYDTELEGINAEYHIEKEEAMQIVQYQPVTTNYFGDDFDCSNIHKNIQLVETKPKPNFNFKRAYQQIYDKYRININSFNNRFEQLLQSRIPTREERKLFGSGINSKRLCDVKNRYWYRTTEELGMPSIAVLVLIDGSGSMVGERRNGAMVSSIILHEVLKKQGITHAIVEHRAVYGENLVNHNILVDFQARDEQKYNLLNLKADDGTREGLSLYWAENYIQSNTSEENKLIIVISDGVPTHSDGNYSYVPPVSTKDTANAAIKIIKRGTEIIAIALDESSEYSCYDDLKEVYPEVIACSNLKQLTGQLLRIVSRKMG
ncbi:MAG: hypothetical protein GX800_07380 [Clostridiaceae bacterium]|nr:hypothetical protein [Clostridiaceae bacterium]